MKAPILDICLSLYCDHPRENVFAVSQPFQIPLRSKKENRPVLVDAQIICCDLCHQSIVGSPITVGLNR